MKIKYTIKKHEQLSELNNKNIYVLWKEGESDSAYGCRGIFQGTRKECEEELSKIKPNCKKTKIIARVLDFFTLI